MELENLKQAYAHLNKAGKIFLHSDRKKTRVCEKKTTSSRLAQQQKAQFTGVNEHFCRKRNEEPNEVSSRIHLKNKIRYLAPYNYRLEFVLTTGKSKTTICQQCA